MTGTVFAASSSPQTREQARLVFGREIWEWIGPLSGLAFAALICIGTFLGDPNSEARDINPDQASAPIADLLVESRDEGRLGVAIALVAIFFLFWFVGFIYRRLRSREGGRSDLAIVALGGGFVTAATMLVLLHTELALYTVSDYGNEPVVARTLAALAWDTSVVLGVPIAAFVCAASASALLHGALPRWLGWLGLPIVVTLLIMVTAWMGLALFLLWVILVSVITLLKPAHPAVAAWDTAAA